MTKNHPAGRYNREKVLGFCQISTMDVALSLGAMVTLLQGKKEGIFFIHLRTVYEHFLYE